jgi:hypothetical protein
VTAGRSFTEPQDLAAIRRRKYLLDASGGVDRIYDRTTGRTVFRLKAGEAVSLDQVLSSCTACAKPWRATRGAVPTRKSESGTPEA